MLAVTGALRLARAGGGRCGGRLVALVRPAASRRAVARGGRTASQVCSALLARGAALLRPRARSTAHGCGSGDRYRRLARRSGHKWTCAARLDLLVPYRPLALFGKSTSSGNSSIDGSQREPGSLRSGWAPHELEAVAWMSRVRPSCKSALAEGRRHWTSASAQSIQQKPAQITPQRPSVRRGSTESTACQSAHL